MDNVTAHHLFEHKTPGSIAVAFITEHARLMDAGLADSAARLTMFDAAMS